MKRLICVTLMSMILLPLLPNFIFTSEAHVSSVRTVWENAWTLTTFHENGKVNSTFFTVPKVIWNGSQWVGYIFNSSDMSGGIGSVYVKFRPTYATIYDPNRTEVRIQDERWVVEWYDEPTNGWRSDESYYDEISYTTNSSGICFIRKSSLYSGSILKVSYVLEKGARLKHLIELTSSTTRTYRIVWKLEGINGNRARLATGVIDATSKKTICNTAAERTTTSCIQFIDDFNNTKVSLNWIDTFWFNKTTGKYETCFQGLEFSSASFLGHVQAKVLFGNFTLTKGETAYLDPTITTFGSEPPLDGYIYKYAAGEYPPSQETHVVTGENYITVGQIGIPDRPPYPYYKYRGYVSFDTFSIPSLAYNISAMLKLKTSSRPDTDFTLKVMGGQQPIYDNSLDVDDWDAGNLTITTWNTANYPGDHIYVNLPISSDQINKVGRTQFRLVSNRDEENIEPDDREHIMFYSGNSTGNEPKLEVTYYLNIVNINGMNWYYRNISCDKVVIILFGGYTWYTNFVCINCIDHIGWPVTTKSKSQIEFAEGLIENGFSVLTNKDDPAIYQADSRWVENAVTWLRNNTYKYIHIFGFSAGGVAVGYEIQKEYASLFSSAVISSAPVNSSTSTDPIFRSACTASKVKVATCFIEGVEDGFYNQMLLYYNNTLADKEWHDWYGGHCVFPNTCKDHLGETVATAASNWYNAPHPPSTPFTPSGPTSGYRNVWYTYSTSTIDPNGDNVRYQFEFTGPSTNVSFTTGWYPSGQTGNITVQWEPSDPLGTYYVRVHAQDVYDAWGGWSASLQVSIRDPTLTISASSGGTTNPAPGTYTYSYGSSVTVTASAYSDYVFDCWLLDGSTYYQNQITVTMNSDHTLTAYFRYGGTGGGSSCPTLFVWNGNGYVDYGVIDIHNPTGEDVIREVPIQSEDMCINSHKAKFRLREGWEGLNYSESVIDQVKLYAIGNDGNRYLCPLISAEHSRLGNVLPQLLLSDDYRAQMLLLETVDLTFVVPWQNIQGFTFAIEGCNIFKSYD
ncbi:MAG: hypothetical protein OEZ25_03530 [Candidatus Bathyarchaeota archaeon]|nr:hypothetical protein [Candidatus Bathyarchaeota archaeon]